MRLLLLLVPLFISCDENSSGPSDNNESNQCLDLLCWNLDDDGVLDNYNNFQYNGSITSAIIINEVSSANSGDVLAAFVGEELRGVAIATPVPFGPHEGTFQFLMLIYSNIVEGESIYFKFYNYQEDISYDINETMIFTSDMIFGDVVDPILFYLN